MNDIQVLKDECLACRRCSIGGQMVHGKYISNVFSNMHYLAKVMVLGQNPGKDEVEMGEPFVGISGRYWDEAVVSIGMNRSDFYISNVVRCYTPENRRPLPEEMDNCRYFLDKEISIIKPLIVVALGGLALKQLTGLGGIMKHHGTAIFSPRYKTFVFPMLHPSPLNIDTDGNEKIFLDDLRKLKEALDNARSENT